MRARAWWSAATFGAVIGMVATTLPVVPGAMGSPGPPRVRLEGARLTDRNETVHAGWDRTVDRSANLVGVQWNGDGAAQFEVQARHGDRWTTVATTTGLDEEGPDPGTREAQRAAAAAVGHATDAIWVGDAKSVRVRLKGGTARDVRVTTIQSPRASAPEGVAGASLTPNPGIVGRAAWGADENLRLANCPEGPDYAPTVKIAVVHHTGGSNNYGPGDTPAIVRGLYAYATQTLKYCDTHYNFFVDRYGQVFEGRYGGTGRPVIGAHATGINTGSVGIAMIGNFQVQQPPVAAVESLKKLLAFELSYYGIDPTKNVQYTTIGGTDRYPAGSTITFPPIVGHRDPGITDCPGTYLYAQLPAIRFEVARRIVTGPVDWAPGWTAQAGKPALMVLNDYGGVFPAGGAPRTFPPGVWPGWSIARDVALLPGGQGGYVLDGFGALHPFGNAPQMPGVPYFGFDIARDFVLRPGGGGYVLDGWGGIHPVGGAPPLTNGPYFPGVDIARKLALANGGGYLMDGYGGVFALSGAPAPGSGPYWPGWDIAKDLVARPGGPGVYVMDGFGGVYGFAGAPKINAPYFGSDRARGLVLTSGSAGYSMTIGGILRRFGGAPAVAQARATFAGAPSLFSPVNARSVALG
jgi:hypothetical protein